METCGIRHTDRTMLNGSVRLAVKFKAWFPTQAEWILASQSIQPEEKSRIGKFVFKRDAKSALVGRLLIRKVLADKTGIPFKDIRLGRTDKGKPYLQNPLPDNTSSLSFNISHQGDYAVIAAETDWMVGVDVMKVEPRGKDAEDFFSTMQRQLTEYEWASVRSQSTQFNQWKTFYRHWCLKESFVKVLGIGIGFEVGRLQFHAPTKNISPNEIVTDASVLVDGKHDSDWLFEETFLDDHCVAVAVKARNQDDQSKLSSKKATGFEILSVPELLTFCEPISDSEPDLFYWENFNAKPEEPTGSN